MKEIERRVESGKIQTHDEIRRDIINAVEDWMQEEFALFYYAKMERGVGEGRYDARIGKSLYFEIKSEKEGIQKGISDAKEYIKKEEERAEFIVADGIQAAHVNSSAEVIVGPDSLGQFGSHLRSLLLEEVSEPGPNDIVDSFGPHSPRVQTYIKRLWSVFQEYRDIPRVKSAFEAWKKIYAEAANLNKKSVNKIEKQASEVGINVSGKEDSYAFLFIVQTYFSVFLKLFSGRLSGDYESAERKINSITFPESYRGMSIQTRVVEHDLFDWFVEPSRQDKDVSEKLKDIILRIGRSVDQIKPDAISTDALRKLYQNSFESSTRKAMGEFYTNDALVAEVLDSVGYEGEKVLNESLLDPTCGSGTFILHALRRFREAAEDAGLGIEETAERAISAIRGIDLHPFAVAMARTNYLLALGQAAKYVDNIPVYWTDSLAPSVPREPELNPKMRISVAALGEVKVPYTEDMGPAKTFSLLEKALEADWRESRFLGEVESVFGRKFRMRYENTCSNLYKFFESEVKNGMWIPAFRDAGVVLGLKKECDYLVGNPPWVRRRNLEEGVRQRLKSDFEFPGDYSLAFVEAGLRFLNEGGKLGFVITSSIVRTRSGKKAREGLLDESTLMKLADYSFSPKNLFEDAENVPLVLALAKEEWDNDDEVKIELINRDDDRWEWSTPIAQLPLEQENLSSPWTFLPPKVLSGARKMQNGSTKLGDIYPSNMGIKAKTGVFFIDEFEQADKPGEVVVTTDGGETVRVEQELIYPLIRGGNVDPWNFEIDGYILWTHDDKGNVRKDLPPLAKSYFLQHEEELKSQADYNSSDPIWKIYRTSEEKMTDKVAWQGIAKKIESARLPNEIDLEIGKRKLIVDRNVYFLGKMEEETASQLSGFLNSEVVRAYIAGYVNKTGGRYCSHPAWTVNYLPIPNGVLNGGASRIGEISDRLHENSKENISLLRELNKEVSKMYGITANERKEMSKFLDYFTS